MPSEEPARLPWVLRTMMRLTGRRQLPRDVRDLALDAGERRLTWGRAATGEPVLATDRGLWVGERPRIDWPDVERAGWQRPVLTVLCVAEVEGTGERLRLELPDEGELPAAVRTSVTGSVGWSSHYRLSGPGGSSSGGVRVVGRRRPGHDDLDWQLVYDRGTDPGDPAVRAEAESLLQAARSTVG